MIQWMLLGVNLQKIIGFERLVKMKELKESHF